MRKINEQTTKEIKKFISDNYNKIVLNGKFKNQKVQDLPFWYLEYCLKMGHLQLQDSETCESCKNYENGFCAIIEKHLSIEYYDLIFGVYTYKLNNISADIIMDIPSTFYCNNHESE